VLDIYLNYNRRSAKVLDNRLIAYFTESVAKHTLSCAAASSTTPYDFIWLEVMAVATVTCAVAGRTASTAMTMAALGVLAAIGVVSGGAG